MRQFVKIVADIALLMLLSPFVIFLWWWTEHQYRRDIANATRVQTRSSPKQ